MGNSISEQPIVDTPKKNNTSNTKNTTVEVNEMDETFQKIIYISNSLLKEYKNQFLNKNFCNNLALIYEKNLSKFSIKVIKDMYNNVQSSIKNEELLLVLQDMPKNDDKFFVDMFKENLNEHFWKKSVDANLNKFKETEDSLNTSNLNSIIKRPKYIQFKHVNNLLSDLSEDKEEITTEDKEEITTEEEPISGGGNKLNNSIRKNNLVNINSKRENLNRFLNGENKKTNKIEKKNNIVVKLRNAQQLLANTKNILNGKKPNEINLNVKTNSLQINNSKANNSKANNAKANNAKANDAKANNAKANNVKANNSKANDAKANNTKTNNAKSNNSKANNAKENDAKSNNIENNIEIVENKINTKLIEKKINKVQKEWLSPEEYKKKKEREYLERKQKREQEEKEINKKELNNTVNLLVNESLNINKQQNKQQNKEKNINNSLIYYVPYSYTFPENVCNNKKECKITKNQMCQAITDNLIVKNNIIAAILTTIPRKIGKNTYEGGICYQKFLNLDKCNVCIPLNYSSLFSGDKNDINKILKSILLKSEFLESKECTENDGFFYKLSEEEIVTLVKKSTEDAVINPKSKYNRFYLECSKKLKSTYFDNLNVLINILDKLKAAPIINNTTLNIIANETKEIIDGMYNLCNYYYVYAIIALLNSDLDKIVIKEDKLEKSYKIVLENQKISESSEEDEEKI